MEKTSHGMDENLAGALTYGLGWITGALFLVTEPTNRFVRFHAWQSVFVFGVLSIAWFVSVSVVFVGWLIAFVIIPPLSLFLWLFLMYKAYQGERYKLPFAGDFAEGREHYNQRS
jgi:uncharacterized membrane protein